MNILVGKGTVHTGVKDICICKSHGDIFLLVEDEEFHHRYIIQVHAQDFAEAPDLLRSYSVMWQKL